MRLAAQMLEQVVQAGPVVLGVLMAQQGLLAVREALEQTVTVQTVLPGLVELVVVRLVRLYEVYLVLH